MEHFLPTADQMTQAMQAKAVVDEAMKQQILNLAKEALTNAMTAGGAVSSVSLDIKTIECSVQTIDACAAELTAAGYAVHVVLEKSIDGRRAIEITWKM